MEINNITTGKKVAHLSDQNWYRTDQEYFILCSDIEAIELDALFHFDAETLEECLTVDENVRFDSFEHYDFISLNNFNLANQRLHLEEINFYIGANYIILIGMKESPTIDNIKRHVFARIKTTTHAKVTLNKIYYWIFDHLLTDFFTTLEKIEDELRSLETEIINKPDQRLFKQILHWREQTIRAIKYLRPLLYIGDQFLVNENHFIQRENIRFFKNIDIRINKLYDFTLVLKGIADQLIYLYDSALTSKTNETVTRLTVLAIFFGPLTIITGIYGMNFEHMPELEWVYGYPMVLTIMAVITLTLYIIFKRKKWL